MPRSEAVHVQPFPTAEELREWLAPGDSPRISIFLPIQRAVPEVRQNAVLLDRAAREAEQALLTRHVFAPRAAALAAALRRADLDLSRLGPKTAALALLLGDGPLRCIGLHVATPYSVRVATSFALRPLLDAQQRHTHYRVLALSVNRIALFEGAPDGLAPLALDALPASMADLLGEELTEKQIRMRGTARGGTSPAYYSHGSARDERKLDLRRFHEALARALASVLGDVSPPIVLAATDDHQSGLRAILKLPALLEEPLTGNFDHAAPSELHERAWPIAERWRLRCRDEALAAWERARNRGKGVDLLDDVGAAAVAGRVQRLWCDAVRAVPGRLDPATGRRVDGDPDDDFIDALVEAVLLRGGEVVPIEAERLPSTTGLAAELR